MTRNQKCIKKDVHQHEINDLMMLEDSARGTLCAIHQTIHSHDNFPCSKHQMLRLCNPRSFSETLSGRHQKRKTRTLSTNNPPLKKIIRNTNCKQHHSCEPKLHQIASADGNQNDVPAYHFIKHINLEKTYSCPGPMCPACTSLSSSHVELQNHTDDIVHELKMEMEKVREHISHISRERSRTSHISTSTQRQCSRCSSQVEIITNLKNENKKLKREIDLKRKLLDQSKCEATKMKDIFADYNRKITLLQNQIEKCSRTTKLNKQREQQIKTLKSTNEILLKTIKEKDMEISNMSGNMNGMVRAFEETCEKCSFLNRNNQECQESIELLREQLLNSTSQLDEYKSTILSLRKKLFGLKETCKKTINKIKQQKTSYQNHLQGSTQEKIDLLKQISDLTLELQNSTKEVSSQKVALDELQCQCKKYEEQLVEFETFSKKCQQLEQESKQHYEALISAEKMFEADRNDMQKLINELTNIIDANKGTIDQMTRINIEQELVIKSQSVDLLTKDERLELLEKQSENFKNLSRQLEQRMVELSSGPCPRDDCVCLSKELTETRTALNIEKDSQLIKEKIIQDQSQTIIDLQQQMKQKVTELNKALSDTKYLEEEIEKINEKLIEKHTQLDQEIDENETLQEKLKILENQRHNLYLERKYFEDLLHHFQQEFNGNHDGKQLENTGKEYRMAIERMAKDRQKAISAAQFISQTLLDTVSNYQKQADARKKVQVLLTKMLWAKDEQLRDVINKISKINSICKNVTISDVPLNELFFSDLMSNFNSETPSTSTNYSSCSSCNKKSGARKLLFKPKQQQGDSPTNGN